MRNYRFTGLMFSFIALFLIVLATFTYKNMHKDEQHNSYEEPLKIAPLEEDPIKYISDDFQILEGFHSHLPLLVVEWEEEPPISTVWNKAEGRYVTIQGLDPFVDAKLQIYQSEKGANTPWDEPSLEAKIRIKRRGNTSMTYEKAQFLIKTVTESGEYRDLNLLNMGADHEWVLNGSMGDKSLLRNYLANRLVSEILPYTPDSQYCEVIIKKDNQYTYQGVYLLGESIKQGKDRINISEYKVGDNFHSYVVRRDRFDDDGVMLNTYANENGLATEYFGLIYPSKRKANDNIIRYVENDISKIEKILYSNDVEKFSLYPNVIDVDSFVDYFLVNEFLGNYDSGNNSTYCYKDKAGKLAMGPIWDFEGAMDNYAYEPFDTDSLAFQTKPWFHQLCQDHTFVNKLEKRYAYLRNHTFSEKNVMGVIDEIVNYLGGAKNREWYRWGNIYTQDNKYNLLDYTLEDGTVIVREAKDYETEIYRIKTMLRSHGAEIATQLKQLNENAVVTTGYLNKSGIWLFLAACVFIVPLYYISRTR